MAVGISIPAAALEYTDNSGVMTVTLPDEYLILTEKNLSHNTDALKSWGHSVDSFKRLMNDKNIFLYAVDGKGDNQFQLKCWDSDVAATIGDLSSLGGDGLTDAMAAIGEGIAEGEGNLLESSVVSQSGQPFFRFTVNVGSFCYVQYLTVCGGKFYSMVYYNSTAELTDAQRQTAESVFTTVKVSGGSSTGLFNSNNIATVILLGVGILAAVCGIVWVIMTIVSDIRRRRSEPDEIVPDRIEMRRK